MKNAPKPRLSKMFERAEPVTMILPVSSTQAHARVLVRARVIHQRRGTFEARVVTALDQPWAFRVSDQRRNEGVTWARGWDTEEANALRVLEALR